MLTPTPSSSFERRAGPGEYVDAVRRHAKITLLIVALAVGVAAAASFSATKKYRSNTDLLVSPVEASDELFIGFNIIRSGVDGASSVVTAARIVDSPEVRERAARRIRGDARGSSVSIQPLTQSSVISIKATATAPEAAADLANAVADSAVEIRKEQFQAQLRQRIAHLNRQLAAIPRAQRSGNFEAANISSKIGDYKALLGQPDPTLAHVNPAQIHSSAVSPRPVLAMTVAFFASLLIAIGLAVAREILDPRISREEELALVHRLPILARIPKFPTYTIRRFLAGGGPLPPNAWRGYRTLRAVLANAGVEGGLPKSLLVTSATPGDGKTMTSVNLSIALASSGARVILVEGDQHRSMIATVFGIARAGGTKDVGRLGSDEIASLLIPVAAHPGLRVLPSAAADVAEGSHAQTIQRLLPALAPHGDVVVIDGPPLPEDADMLTVAAAVETVLVAVRLGHTRRDRLRELREMLSYRGIQPTGFVVTTLDPPEEAYGYGATEPLDARSSVPTFDMVGDQTARARAEGSARLPIVATPREQPRRARDRR